MRFLEAMVIVGAFGVVVNAESLCDDLTQYYKNGECCNKCGPGTSMASDGNCLEPRCQPCLVNEYQDKYTQRTKCELQPHCDANLNFEPPVHESTKKTTCRCKEGFHCSTDECITCVPHTICEQGHGAQIIGSHSQDTVCQKCGEGTYSDEASWSGVCKNWTKCGFGEHPQKSGTDVSDIVCGYRLRDVAIGVSAFMALLVVVLVMFLCRGRYQGQAKDCVESCRRNQRPPSAAGAVPVTPPADTVEDEEEVMLPEMLSTQEEGHQTPVESDEILFSEQGNVVTQENGKVEQLSRQESQTTTFTDSIDTRM